MIEVDGIEYLTAPEAADAVGNGVTPRIVYDWCRRGAPIDRMPRSSADPAAGVGPVRVGRRVYVTSEQAARAEKQSRTRGRRRASS